MESEPLGEIDPIKKLIMQSVSKFASGEIKGWPALCADLEIGIREFIEERYGK